VAFHARSLRALEETRAFGGITQWFRRFLYQVPICGDTGEDARISTYVSRLRLGAVSCVDVFQTSSLAAQGAQIIELGAAHF